MSVQFYVYETAYFAPFQTQTNVVKSRNLISYMFLFFIFFYERNDILIHIFSSKLNLKDGYSCRVLLRNFLSCFVLFFCF